MAASQRIDGKRSFTDLSGRSFGCITVLRRHVSASRRIHWECRCICGAARIIRGDHLERYVDHPECRCRPFTRHGLSQTREYRIWSNMMRRCYEPSNDNYRFYGGIGRYVCGRWRDSVEAFIYDVGPAPSASHTLDRIDALANYTCGTCDECIKNGDTANCRWATKAEQVRNMKNNLWFSHDGETLILKDWARRVGIDYHILYSRIYRDGLSFADAISFVGDLRTICKQRKVFRNS